MSRGNYYNLVVTNSKNKPKQNKKKKKKTTTKTPKKPKTKTKQKQTNPLYTKKKKKRKRKKEKKNSGLVILISTQTYEFFICNISTILSPLPTSRLLKTSPNAVKSNPMVSRQRKGSVTPHWPHPGTNDTSPGVAGVWWSSHPLPTSRSLLPLSLTWVTPLLPLFLYPLLIRLPLSLTVTLILDLLPLLPVSHTPPRPLPLSLRPL